MAIRRRGDKIVAATKGHVSHWSDQSSVAEKNKRESLLMRGSKEWGHIEYTFHGDNQSWLLSPSTANFRLGGFLILASAFGFYLFIGRLLKKMKPSRTVPIQVRTTLDILGGGLLVLNRSGKIVVANEAFGASCGRDVNDWRDDWIACNATTFWYCHVRDWCDCACRYYCEQ